MCKLYELAFISPKFLGHITSGLYVFTANGDGFKLASDKIQGGRLPWLEVTSAQNS